MRIQVCYILLLGIASCVTPLMKKDSNRLYTNDVYKKCLKLNYSAIIDSEKLFNFIFSHLEHRINISNSENYYYFEFLHSGRHFKGNIALLVEERDEGVLSFSCEEISKVNETYYKPYYIERTFGANDGLKVNKLSKNKYCLKYKGRSVTATLSTTNTVTKNTNHNTSSNSIFLGTSYDESGLPFDLFFNNKTNQFQFFLNEESKKSHPYFIKLTNSIVIEGRTGFAFFKKDSLTKILIGLLKEEEENNSWYDGPFDQLPDNYILSNNINLGMYISVKKTYLKDSLDIFGIYKSDRSKRIAISPYYSYRNIDDLMRHFYQCESQTKNTEELINCLTNDNTN